MFEGEQSGLLSLLIQQSATASAVPQKQWSLGALRDRPKNTNIPGDKQQSAVELFVEQPRAESTALPMATPSPGALIDHTNQLLEKECQSMGVRAAMTEELERRFKEAMEVHHSLNGALSQLDLISKATKVVPNSYQHQQRQLHGRVAYADPNSALSTTMQQAYCANELKVPLPAPQLEQPSFVDRELFASNKASVPRDTGLTTKSGTRIFSAVPAQADQQELIAKKVKKAARQTATVTQQTGGGDPLVSPPIRRSVSINPSPTVYPLMRSGSATGKPVPGIQGITGSGVIGENPIEEEYSMTFEESVGTTAPVVTDSRMFTSSSASLKRRETGGSMVRGASSVIEEEDSIRSSRERAMEARRSGGSIIRVKYYDSTPASSSIHSSMQSSSVYSSHTTSGSASDHYKRSSGGGGISIKDVDNMDAKQLVSLFQKLCDRAGKLLTATPQKADIKRRKQKQQQRLDVNERVHLVLRGAVKKLRDRIMQLETRAQKVAVLKKLLRRTVERVTGRVQQQQQQNQQRNQNRRRRSIGDSSIPEDSILLARDSATGLLSRFDSAFGQMVEEEDNVVVSESDEEEGGSRYGRRASKRAMWLGKKRRSSLRDAAGFGSTIIVEEEEMLGEPSVSGSSGSGGDSIRESVEGYDDGMVGDYEPDRRDGRGRGDFDEIEEDIYDVMEDDDELFKTVRYDGTIDLEDDEEEEEEEEGSDDLNEDEEEWQFRKGKGGEASAIIDESALLDLLRPSTAARKAKEEGHSHNRHDEEEEEEGDVVINSEDEALYEDELFVAAGRATAVRRRKILPKTHRRTVETAEQEPKQQQEEVPEGDDVVTDRSVSEEEEADAAVVEGAAAASMSPTSRLQRVAMSPTSRPKQQQQQQQAAVAGGGLMSRRLLMSDASASTVSSAVSVVSSESEAMHSHHEQQADPSSLKSKSSLVMRAKRHLHHVGVGWKEDQRQQQLQQPGGEGEGEGGHHVVAESASADTVATSDELKRQTARSTLAAAGKGGKKGGRRPGGKPPIVAPAQTHIEEEATAAVHDVFTTLRPQQGQKSKSDGVDPNAGWDESESDSGYQGGGDQAPFSMKWFYRHTRRKKKDGGDGDGGEIEEEEAVARSDGARPDSTDHSGSTRSSAVSSSDDALPPTPTRVRMILAQIVEEEEQRYRNRHAPQQLLSEVEAIDRELESVRLRREKSLKNLGCFITADNRSVAGAVRRNVFPLDYDVEDKMQMAAFSAVVTKRKKIVELKKDGQQQQQHHKAMKKVASGVSSSSSLSSSTTKSSSDSNASSSSSSEGSSRNSQRGENKKKKKDRYATPTRGRAPPPQGEERQTLGGDGSSGRPFFLRLSEAALSQGVQQKQQGDGGIVGGVAFDYRAQEDVVACATSLPETPKVIEDKGNEKEEEKGKGVEGMEDSVEEDVIALSQWKNEQQKFIFDAFRGGAHTSQQQQVVGDGEVERRWCAVDVALARLANMDLRGRDIEPERNYHYNSDDDGSTTTVSTMSTSTDEVLYSIER